LIRKIISTFTSNVAIAAINFIIAVVLSQHLGAAGKGEQSIIITTIAFILIICNIVGGASLVYLVPRFNNIKIIIPSYIWSLFICVFVYFFLGFFNDIPPQFNLHISILTLISSLTSVNTTILLGHEQINKKNIIAVVQTFILVMCLLTMFLIFNLKTIESYVASLYISYSLAFIMSSLFAAKYFKYKVSNEHSNTYLLKQMLRYGILNQLSHITQMLSFRLSFYILLLYIGKDSVGIYSNAVALVESVWLISKSIATVQYARIANTNDNNYARQLTLKLLKSALFMSLFFLLPMALLPASFYTMLFGKDFQQVNKLIMLMAPGVFIYNFNLIIGHYFSGKGRYHINTLASTAGLIVTVVLCLVLIPIWGVYGAAFAALISFISTSAIVFVIFKKDSQYSICSFFPNKNDILEYISYIKSLIPKKQ